jgi:uncharacterized protein YabN with tetrapyrrole methylase and pyrophosphatase domain
MACSNAAENGHLNILKYLHENGCPWNKWTYIKATRHGHLNVLKYLHENGCPWDENICYWTVRNNHSHILKWIVAYGICRCYGKYH